MGKLLGFIRVLPEFADLSSHNQHALLKVSFASRLSLLYKKSNNVITRFSIAEFENAIRHNITII